MQTKNVLLSLVVIAATGLAGCQKAKKSPEGIRARGEIAKKQSVEKQQSIYDEADAKISNYNAKLNELGVKATGKGFVASVSNLGSKILPVGVKPEDRDEARKLLEKVIHLADTQIGLAKSMGNGNLQAKSEETKANAQEQLERIENAK